MLDVEIDVGSEVFFSVLFFFRYRRFVIDFGLYLCFRHSHITGEEDAQWVEFLLKAVRHNADKLRQLQKP